MEPWPASMCGSFLLVGISSFFTKLFISAAEVAEYDEPLPHNCAADRVAPMARSRQTSVMLLSPTSMSFMSCVTWKVRDACWEVASFLGKETVVPVRLVHMAVQWNS